MDVGVIGHAGSAAPPNRPGPILAVFSATILLSVLVAFALWTHRSIDAESIKSVERKAQIVEQHLLRSLNSVSFFFRSVERSYNASGQGLPAFLESNWFETQTEYMELPQLDGMLIADADGAVLVSSDADLVGHNIADRAYFSVQRYGPDSSFFVGGPVMARTNGHRVLPVSKKIRGPDGEFAGVIAASLSVGYFSDFFNRAASQSSSEVAVFQNSGELLFTSLNSPAQEQSMAASLQAVRAAIGAAQPDANAASIVRVDLGSLGDWFAEIVEIPGLRMQVLVLQSRDTLFQEWLLAVLLLAAVCLLALGIALFGAWELERYARRLQLSAAEARTANEAKSRFVALVSHDLRTPLNAVMGELELLKRETNTAIGRRRIASIGRAGQLLLHIVNDLLDLGQLENGQVSIRSEPFNPAVVIKSIANMLRAEAEQKGLTMEVKTVAPKRLRVQGDPIRFQQIAFNLLTNAIKYTPSGQIRATLSVQSSPDNQSAELSLAVSDTGPGVSDAMADTIFQPFNRGEVQAGLGPHGVGLGLAIVRHLVEAMDGVISVEPIGVDGGRGSTFVAKIRCPIVDEELEIAAVSNKKPSFRGPLSILVAEDNATNRELVADMLRSHPHRLIFAENGEKAVHLASEQSFDVIFMDVQMPVLNGVEAAQAIRFGSGANRTTPIYAMTANIMKEHVGAYTEAGMTGVIGKPVEWERFFDILDETPRRTICAAAPAVPALSDRVFDMDRLAEMQRHLAPGQLRGLCEGALDEGARELERLDQESVSAEDLRRCGHMLRGMLGAYGFIKLVGLSEALEQTSKGPDAARSLVLTILSEIQTTRSRLASLDLEAHVVEQPEWGRGSAAAQG